VHQEKSRIALGALSMSWKQCYGHLRRPLATKHTACRMSHAGLVGSDLEARTLCVSNRGCLASMNNCEAEILTQTRAG
jgi:hypothetical protein